MSQIALNVLIAQKSLYYLLKKYLFICAKICYHTLILRIPIFKGEVFKLAKVFLNKVCKIFPENLEVVKDVTLDIDDNDFVVMVGPSGCGKSTTLRMIAGLEEISRGELYIDDVLSNDIPPKDRDIAMVFQNYALYPHMTVFDNMAFGLKLRKINKDEIKRRVEEAATLLDISHLLTRKPKALSGGQRQRVALGRAIVREPKVFLLDEPLSNLDAKLRSQMRAEISKLHKKLGTTFIYVTHDQTEAMTMGNKIVVMKDGQIQQVDSPQNLYKLPCNTFVASFIGSPQMNFIDATLTHDNENFTLVANGFKFNLPDKCNTDDIKPYENKPIVIGVRPENLSYSPDNLSSNYIGKFKATVDMTELIGSDIYLYLTVNGNNIISKVDISCNFKSGDVIDMFIDTSKIHLFDASSGVAIAHLSR